MRKSFILFYVGLLLAFCGNPGEVAGRVSFSLKPDLPKIFYQGRRTVDNFRHSGYPWLIDMLTGLTPVFNLIFTAGTPETVILPAIGVNQPAGRGDLRLTALTANLMLFPPPFYTDQHEKIEEFARLVRSLNPDIIFLQEIWDNHSLYELIRKFADYHAVLMPSPLFNHAGLLTLSRFKPERSLAWSYPLTLHHNFEELIARKGLLLAEINFAGEKIALLNTHLYSAGLGVPFKPSFGQFAILQRHIELLAELTVVGGDLNLQPQELEPLLKDGMQRDDCNLPTAGGPSRRSKKLDYILAKGNKVFSLQILGSRTEWPVFFSDHSPFFAEIRLNRLY